MTRFYLQHYVHQVPVNS